MRHILVVAIHRLSKPSSICGITECLHACTLIICDTSPTHDREAYVLNIVQLWLYCNCYSDVRDATYIACVDLALYIYANLRVVHILRCG